MVLRRRSRSQGRWFETIQVARAVKDAESEFWKSLLQPLTTSRFFQGPHFFQIGGG